MIDIIIVNWNSGQQLNSAIRSVARFNSELVSSVVVVDNASTDQSCDAMESYELSVKVIRNNKNKGFAAACNQGAAICSADYLLFLNPDTRLFENSLSVPLTFMSDPKNASIGICGIQMINEIGEIDRTCARFPIAKMFFLQSLGLAKLSWLKKFGHHMAEWDHLETRHVDQVIGAFFLVRRSLFDMLNGFDERFFVYFEEVDFSKRASDLGWQSIYLSEAQAFHAGGGTSRQVKAHRLFYSLRSRLLYTTKHFSLPGAVLVLLSTLLLEPFSRTTLALMRRSWPAMKETWQAYAMLWRWLPQWVFKGVTR